MEADRRKSLIPGFDPSKSHSDNWDAGIAMDDAWLLWADPATYEQYRNSGRNEGLSCFLKKTMQEELREALYKGELTAFGIQTQPTLANSPEPLPTPMFRREISTIDWVDGTVSGLNRAYQAVVLCRTAVPIVTIDAPSRASTIQPAKRGGRRDTYEFIAKVLDELYNTIGYRTLSAEDLHVHFCPLFECMFPISEYNLPTPSARTLRTKIARYWKELAETGNN